MYIILFKYYYHASGEMDEHTCYILSLRLTFLQTVNMTSKNILLEYSTLIPQHFDLTLFISS